MIRTETFMLNDREFTRTWSDANRYVVRDGVSYNEANDPSEYGRVYTEGELMPPEDVAAQAEEILSILLGGNEA